MIISDRPLGTADLDHWLWREVARFRSRAIKENIAFFPSVEKAAQAVNELIEYRRRNAH